jgi:hypothetical protein
VNSRDRRPCLRMRARSCTTANAVARCCGRTWAIAAYIARTDRFPVHRSSGSVSGAPLVLDPTRVTDVASQTIVRSRFEAIREAYDKGRRSIHSYGLRVKTWGRLGGPSARHGRTQTRSQRCQAPPGCWPCGTSDAAAEIPSPPLRFGRNDDQALTQHSVVWPTLSVILPCRHPDGRSIASLRCSCQDKLRGGEGISAAAPSSGVARPAGPAAGWRLASL